jgi:ubiquinone/menaquinone biosynthesis C-methylase UbiE
MTLVPKGNTQVGVNSQVYRLLCSAIDLKNSQVLIDVPCGEGQFAEFLKSTFPNLQVIGIDPFANASAKKIQFHKQKAHDFFLKNSPQNIDAITCISGVMCFDGAETLISSFHQALKANGFLAVTNDNVLTVRDRLSFLFFGRLKRFKLFYSVNEGNWNVLLPQAIFMLFERQGFKNISIKTTSVYAEDWIFLPLAFLLYPFMFLAILFSKSSRPLSERLKMFPFSLLLARHYVVSAVK